MATGAIVGLALSLIGGGMSTWGAYRTEKDKKNAQDRDQKLAEELNLINYKLWREGRGEGGNVTFPLYAPPDAEVDAFNSAYQSYLAGRSDDPAGDIERYQNMVKPMSEALKKGEGEIDRILSGQSETDRLKAYDPVARARMNVAATSKEGTDLALQQALSKVRAADAMGGYAGTGSYAENNLLKTAIPYRQAGAKAMADAALTNAGERYSIPLSEQALRLKTIPMTGAAARERLTMEQLPTAALSAREQEAFGPLNRFMLEPDHFSFGPLPATSQGSPTGALYSGIGGMVSNAAGPVSGMFGGGAPTGLTMGQVEQGGVVPGMGTPSQKSVFGGNIPSYTG